MRKSQWIALLVATAVIAVGLVLHSSSGESSPTTTTTPTTTAVTNDSSAAPASSTTAVSNPAAAPVIVPGWKLTAANTGLARHGLKCGDLPAWTGGEFPKAGTVISRKRITHNIYLAAGNITIEQSCIQPTSAGQGMPFVSTGNPNTLTMTQTPVTIRDSEFDGSKLDHRIASLAAGFHGVANLQNNYFHDIGSGIAYMGTGEKLSAVAEGNYVTKMLAWGDPATTGNHSDAFTVRDFENAPGRTLVIRNNRFDCNSGSDTGAFFIQTYAGNIFNMTAEGNLLEGRGYQLMLEEKDGNTYGNLRAINNRMSGTGYGAGYVDKGPGWAQQRDNYINDPSKPDNKGKPVSF